MSVFGLHDQAFGAVEDAQPSQLDGGCGFFGVQSFSGSLNSHQLGAGFIQEVVESTGCVAAATDAGNDVIGVVSSFFFLQLASHFAANDRLEAGYHVGVRVWPNGTTYDVKGVGGVAAPVAHGFVGGVFQGHVARGDGHDSGSQHPHLLHIQVLAFHIGLAHIHHAFHVHQGADSGCGHAVLAGSGFGDDAGLAHAPGQNDLAYGVVDFVGAGVVEVFALQIHLATVFFRQTAGQVQG